MRYTIIFFFLILYNGITAQKSFVVAELFTSEGCSSCPPADKVLSDLKAESKKNKQQIIFLEYHVDYWNRLGWKDPFSKNQFTLRQENYSRVLPGKEVYTPQLVINGETELTGSDKNAAKAAIQKAMGKTQPGDITLISKEIRNDTLVINYRSGKADKNSSVKIAITEDDIESNVLHGENNGKKLHHDALVRIFYSSEEAEENGWMKIPLRGFVPVTGMQLAGFIQNKQTLRITAATQLTF